jgi:diguanylate cyclase (GGDEF)-like protein
MLLGYRSNDAVLTICQNNKAKSIEISGVNPVAEQLLGYASGDLSGLPLKGILPPRIADLLAEYVEYGHDGHDVGNVLSKVQSFSVIDKDGREEGYRLKVVRAESTPEKAMFKLVLQDRMGIRKNEQLRQAIQENFKGHEVLDSATGLPDRQSLAKDIELMGYYNRKGEVRSCFAVLQLDHFDPIIEQYGPATGTALLRHIAGLSRQNLRPDDVVGVLSTKRIGVLLLDTTPESARMVFNRLRWQIAANPFMLPDKTTLGLSVSISFTNIIAHGSDKKLIDACEEAMDGLAPGSANGLVEVGW